MSQMLITFKTSCKYPYYLLFWSGFLIVFLFLWFSKILEDHRHTCEVEGKYVEAEMAKNRIAELKAQDFNRRHEELIFNQTQQREECEQAHIK